MFKEIRRKERQLLENELENILKHGEYGVLATMGSNGYPYAVPLSYVFIENSIYFHCAEEGTKLENIKNLDAVSFCVIGKTKVLPDKFSTEYESVIAFGKAYEAGKDEKIMVLRAIVDKYSPEYKIEGDEYLNRAIDKTKVIGIKIEHVTGKGRR